MVQKSNITPGKVYECEHLAFKIDRLIKNMNKKVKDSPLSSIDMLDTFLLPRNGIKKVIEFYESLILASREIELKESSLKSSCLVGEKDTYGLDFLDRKGFVDNMDVVMRNLGFLNMYTRVNIVEDFLKIHRPFVEKCLCICRNSFLHSLRKNAPGFEEAALRFSKFLMANVDRKAFFNEYSKVFYDKFKLKSFDTKLEEALEKVLSFQSLFSEIDNTNSALLEKEDSENITKVITEILLVDLKQKISSTLINISKRNKPSDMAFIVALSPVFVAPKNKFGPVFEQLSDLKEECLKLARNLFVTLYENIGFTSRPNKFCDAEAFVVQANVILKAFDKYEDFSVEFMRRCPLISSRNIGDLKAELGCKCYEKIVEISGAVTGVRRNIFLINNFYVIKGFLKEFGGIKLSDKICENQDIISTVWDKECSKRKNTNVTNFINANIEVQKRYFLPEEVKVVVVERIRNIIMEIIEVSAYDDTKDHLEKGLSQLFSGK